MGPQDLTNLLWRERELLDLLVFKLEEEQLILSSGKTRWLDLATKEVEHVLGLLRSASLERSAVVAAVAVAWGLEQDASLPQLAAAAPEGPWEEILTAHHRGMLATVAQIRQLRDTNLQFLQAGMMSAQDTIASLVPEPGVYDHRGHTSLDSGSRFLDKSV